MADILSKKATVKNIYGTNPVMIHPVGGTRAIRPGESYTGVFTLGEIASMEASEQYDVTSAAEHKSAEPQTEDDNSGSAPVKKLTKEEKAAAKAANAALPAAPVVPPVAPTLPGAGGLPSALQLPGSGN